MSCVFRNAFNPASSDHTRRQKACLKVTTEVVALKVQDISPFNQSNTIGPWKHTCQLDGRPLESSTKSGCFWLCSTVSCTAPAVSRAARALLRLTLSRLHKTRNMNSQLFVQVRILLDLKGLRSPIPITTQRLKISIIFGLSTSNLLCFPLLQSNKFQKQKLGWLQYSTRIHANLYFPLALPF